MKEWHGQRFTAVGSQFSFFCLTMLFHCPFVYTEESKNILEKMWRKSDILGPIYLDLLRLIYWSTCLGRYVEIVMQALSEPIGRTKELFWIIEKTN